MPDTDFNISIKADNSNLVSSLSNATSAVNNFSGSLYSLNGRLKETESKEKDASASAELFNQSISASSNQAYAAADALASLTDSTNKYDQSAHKTSTAVNEVTNETQGVKSAMSDFFSVIRTSGIPGVSQLSKAFSALKSTSFSIWGVVAMGAGIAINKIIEFRKQVNEANKELNELMAQSAQDGNKRSLAMADSDADKIGRLISLNQKSGKNSQEQYEFNKLYNDLSGRYSDLSLKDGHLQNAHSVQFGIAANQAKYEERQAAIPLESAKAALRAIDEFKAAKENGDQDQLEKAKEQLEKANIDGGCWLGGQ